MAAAFTVHGTHTHTPPEFAAGCHVPATSSQRRHLSLNSNTRQRDVLCEHRVLAFTSVSGQKEMNRIKDKTAKTRRTGQAPDEYKSAHT